MGKLAIYGCILFCYILFWKSISMPSNVPPIKKLWHTENLLARDSLIQYHSSICFSNVLNNLINRSFHVYFVYVNLFIENIIARAEWKSKNSLGGPINSISFLNRYNCTSYREPLPYSLEITILYTHILVPVRVKQ